MILVWTSYCNLSWILTSDALQEILPGKSPDPEPQEHDDDGGDNQEHHEGDGDPDKGGSVEAEALGDGVQVDHHLVLVILRQLELDIRGRHDLGDT